MKMLLLGIFAFLFVCTASADPTTNVARVSYIDGAVTYSPSGVDDWVYAKLNHTLIAGDRLWVDANARAELQLGSATFRVWSSTYLSILNFNNETTQFQLNQGSLSFHVYKSNANQTYEIDTPNLAFTTDQSGDYRADVSADGKTTTISIISGQGTVYDSKKAAYALSAKQSYIFTGTGWSEYTSSPLDKSDDFDQWRTSRQMRVQKAHQSISTHKYVSPHMIGAEDLDSNGTWQSNDTYGNVWTPSQVDPNWAPYSDGSWVWVNQYGWTWVDNSPWGFAPYHYGRWVYFEDHWSWVPGPPEVIPVYAPALVIFIFGGGFGGIGWFPLGYNDIYIPPYPYSHHYFQNINESNARINNAMINNVYNHPNQLINYRNRHAHNAIVAMPTNAFVNSTPVNKARIPVPKNIAVLPVNHIAPLTPTVNSITGGGKPATIKPSPAVLNRPVISNLKPQTIVPFDPSKLANHPGVPLEPAHNETPIAGGIVVPHPPGVIVKPNELKPEHPNVQPLVPERHENPSAGGVIVPHPPGVIVPHEHNIQPSQPVITKPEVLPSTGFVPHPSEVRPQQQIIQPRVDEQQQQQTRMQQMQQQEEAQRQARIMQQQQAQAEQKAARMQQMEQQRIQAQQQAARMQQMQSPSQQHIQLSPQAQMMEQHGRRDDRPDH